MKAVILAAGLGTRLGSLIPKPLTILKNKKTILDFQIKKLANKVGIHNIIVVIGYKKEMIMEKYPNLQYVYNKTYDNTNTAKSLLQALNKIEEDTIWLNGDVFFDKEVLDLLLPLQHSACLVNTSRCGKEEIKYSLNKQGFIKNLSKQIKNGVGEAVGINLIKQGDLHIFREELQKVNNTDYFEKALENLIKKNKLKLLPINIVGSFCQEIDFVGDLKIVQQYLNNHQPQ